MEVFYKNGLYSLEVKDSETNPNHTIVSMYDVDGNVIWSYEDSIDSIMRTLRKILKDWTVRNLIDFDVMDEKELTLYGILMEEK